MRSFASAELFSTAFARWTGVLGHCGDKRAAWSRQFCRARLDLDATRVSRKLPPSFKSHWKAFNSFWVTYGDSISGVCRPIRAMAWKRKERFIARSAKKKA